MNHASAVCVFTLCLIKSDATKSLWVCKMVKISVNHTFKANDDIPTCILRILVIYRLLLVWGNFRDLIQKTRLKKTSTGLCICEFHYWDYFVKMFAIHPQLTDLLQIAGERDHYLYYIDGADPEVCSVQNWTDRDNKPVTNKFLR